MRMWNKAEKNQTKSFRRSNVYNRILSMFLMIAIVGSSFAGVASAAEETVSSINISVNQSGPLYVEDNSIILSAYATYSGSSPDKNVTEDAIWTSTSTSIKVVKGVVTATGAVSSATITARYKKKTDTFSVSSEYFYDEVKLRSGSGDAPDKQDINLGPNLELKAQGTGGSVDADITATAQWTTSNSAVATVSNGTVTLLTAGTVTITVKSKGKSDSIVLTVASPYSSIDILDSDSKVIDGPIDMLVDEDESLNAKATLKSGGSSPILDETSLWTTSNAAIVKVDDTGKITAVGAGTAIVSAKRFGVTDSVTVIVRTEYEALRVTPNKPIYMMLNGSGVELTAEALNGFDDPEDISLKMGAEWKISDADQAVASINKVGKVTVEPKGVGTAKITVSYKGLSKDFSITVFPTINSIEISKETIDVFTEDTTTLPTVSGKTVAGDSKDVGKLVTWTSSDNSVVSIEDGKLKALKKGTATLAAEVEAAGQTIKDTVSVEVHNKILTLVPSTDTISVVLGKEVDFPKVQLIYEDGEEETISDKITWKSSTPNLLVKPTKMKGLLPATATLTGTYLNKTVKIKVTVEEEFASFIIAPTKVSVTLNKSQTIKVTGITKSGKKVTLGSRIDWSASNEDHLTIKGASVKGLAEGSGKLTATVQGRSLEIPYVVTAKLTKLTASATSVQPAIGDQASIVLTALYENGKTANVTALATWTTSKAAVATVTDGNIKPIGKGSASIKGTFGGKSVTIRVSVK